MNNYLELAEKQFNQLKEDTLENATDKDVVGAVNEKEYEIDGVKFKIKINGFWESATWCDWFVYDENDNKIDSGTILH